MPLPLCSSEALYTTDFSNRILSFAHLVLAACANMRADLVGSEFVSLGNRHEQEWMTDKSEIIHLDVKRANGGSISNQANLWLLSMCRRLCPRSAGFDLFAPSFLVLRSKSGTQCTTTIVIRSFHHYASGSAATAATRPLTKEEETGLSASGGENGVSFCLNALAIEIRFSALLECVQRVVANASGKWN